jgi:putative DNA primase/helicase
MIIGSDNCAAVQPSLFGNQFNRAFLHRKLVNIVSELQAGAVIEDAALKAIVSGESMNVSRKHETPFDMAPFCTCWFGTNHLPHTRDFTQAMFRRATLLQFNRQFIAGVDADPKLKTIDYWQDDLPGILRRSLEAYGRAIRAGTITDPKSSIEAKESWRLEADQAAAFSGDCIERLPGNSVKSSDLYGAFRAWANEQGISHIISNKAFSNRMEMQGFSSRHTRTGTIFDGIYIHNVTDVTDFL